MSWASGACRDLLAIPYSDWTMSLDARMVLEAFLLTMKPSRALYIGSEIEGAVARISAHSTHVYALGAGGAGPASSRVGNVTIRDRSQQSLPDLLREIAQAGNTIDLVLVDREQTARGVREDLRDLLLSPCVGCSVILIHDVLNERVRAGLEQVAWESFDNVQFFDADFVAGRLFRAGTPAGQLWGGFGLVLTDAAVEVQPMRLELEPMPGVFDAFLTATSGGSRTARPRYHELARLERQVAELKTSVRVLNASLASVVESRSWRLTRPLRHADLLVQRLVRQHRRASD